MKVRKFCMPNPIINTHPLSLDAKATPGGVAEEAAGVRNAAGDSLTQTHRMTIDEAHLILNIKRGEPLTNALKVRLTLWNLDSFVTNSI